MGKKIKKPMRNFTLFILIAAFIFYLFTAIFSLQEFSIQDEILIESSVAAINLKGHPEPRGIGFIYPAGDIAGSIPLYYYILAFLSKIWGINKVTFIAFGIFCAAVTLILLYFIARQAADNNESAVLLACILFITHPMAIQGSTLVEIDNTLLMVAMNFFILLYLKLQRAMTLKSLFLLGLFFFILLWVKISTPLVLPVVIFVFNILQNKLKRGFYHAGAIFFCGCAIFIISWLVYCSLAKYNLLLPFAHNIKSIVRHPFNAVFNIGPFAIVAGLKEILRLSLWIGVFPIILGLFTFVYLIKDFLRDKKLLSLHFLAIYVFLLWGCYLVIVGTVFSFPRYYLPALPAFLVCLSVFAIRAIGPIDKKSLVFYCALGIALALFYYFVVGDLLYSINFSLKKAAIFSPLEVYPELNKAIFKLILYMLPVFPIFVIVWLYNKKGNILKVTVLTLVILMLTTNLSLDLLQAKAGYNTTYDYGEVKKAGVINFLRSKVRAEDVILTPIDIPYYLNNKNFIFFDYRVIGSAEEFIKVVAARKVACVAYGTNSFNLAYYSKVVMNAKTQRFLERYFKKINISSYTIWLRYQ